jgi:hypothetical protein
VATATGQPETGGPVTSAPSTVTVPGTHTSSLSLVKSTSSTGYFAAGQLITYTYAVTNTGTTTLHNISVSDNKIAAANITCPTTPLAPGATVDCTGLYTTTLADVNAGAVNNVATASGVDPFGASISSNTSQVSLATVLPPLQMTKSVNATVAAPGDVLTYTVTVVNTTNTDNYGSGTLPPASFSDSLNQVDQDATLVPGSPTATTGTVTVNGQVIVWSGALNAGDTAKITYQVMIDNPDTGPHMLTNSIVSTTPGASCPPTGAAAACTITTPVADISVAKQVCGSQVASNCGPNGTGPWGTTADVPNGGTAYWKITATNTGSVPLAGVTLNDTLVPACATAAGTFSLPVGGSLTVYCSSTATSSLTNVATASFPQVGGPPGSGPFTSAGGTASISVPAAVPPAPVGPVGPAVTG